MKTYANKSNGNVMWIALTILMRLIYGQFTLGLLPSSNLSKEEFSTQKKYEPFAFYV